MGRMYIVHTLLHVICLNIWFAGLSRKKFASKYFHTNTQQGPCERALYSHAVISLTRLLCHFSLKGVVGTERYLTFRERTILFCFFFWSIVHRILSQIRNNRCSFWWRIFAAQWQKKNKTEILSEMPGFLTKIHPKKLGEFWFLKNYHHFLTAPKSMSPPCYKFGENLGWSS
jgi:hypothetical protein